MIRRPPRSTPLYSSAASDVYKRQYHTKLHIISRNLLRAAMASGVPVARAARVVSRDPAARRAPLSSRSLVAVGGDAFGQLVSMDPRTQAQQSAGTLVPMGGQGEFVPIPIGMGDEGLDDVEEWERSPSVPVLVDAVGEFNRARQGGAMPAQDMEVTPTSVIQTPVRRTDKESQVSVADRGGRGPPTDRDTGAFASCTSSTNCDAVANGDAHGAGHAGRKPRWRNRCG